MFCFCVWPSFIGAVLSMIKIYCVTLYLVCRLWCSTTSFLVNPWSASWTQRTDSQTWSLAVSVLSIPEVWSSSELLVSCTSSWACKHAISSSLSVSWRQYIYIVRFSDMTACQSRHLYICDTRNRSRKVSYLKSPVSQWSGEKQRRWRDTTRRVHYCRYVTNQLTNSSLLMLDQ